MKKIISRIIIMLLVVMFTTVILFLASNNIIEAFNSAEKDNWSDIKTYGQLARFVIDKSGNDNSTFWNGTITEIFNMNNNGISSSGSPISYNSAACIFHHQSTGTGGTKYYIQNVIDITAPGTVNVYKYNRR